MIQEEFNKRWGWWELLHNVCDYQRISMPEGLQQPAIMIFMFATLLKEKVQVSKK